MRLMTRLACSTSVTPGKLHEDLVPAAALCGDDGLRDAQLVDAALEGADGLLDGAFLDLADQGIGHLDEEAPLGGLAHLPALAEEVAQDVPHVLDARRLDTLDREGARVEALGARDQAMPLRLT